MARNGAGTFNLLVNSWNPATNGVSATAIDWQSLINDVAASITQSVSADGQTPITGNLQMGNNRLTGLAAGVATGQSVRWEQLFSQGTEIVLASSATTSIGVENSNFLQITGTTTITSLGTAYNGPRFVRFAGALTLTHNATTLILPTGANITTAAGDCAIFVPKGNPSDGWNCVAYQRANGQALVTSIDYLNTTRIDIASATTVDLTANAPNTRNINITGTTTITGFTVAIGQTYFVRFNAALTLTNNAAIVTQTGANIVTAAGDTCIIRSTAANTVEVLSYDGYATTTQRGATELATSAEAIAGTDATRVLTPSTLKSGQIVLGTPIAATSGTFVEFTGLPSWVKRVHVIFNAVSTNGTDNLMVQIGGGSLVTSGYLSSSASGSTTVTITNGFVFTVSVAAASTISGHMILTLSGSNIWVQSHTIGGNVTNITSSGGGVVSLGGALDRVRIATTGANTFDSGTVNISWE